MDEASSLGRQFEFENAFWAKPKKCGFVNLFQVGELGCECDFEIKEHLQICHEITYIISGSGYGVYGFKIRKGVGRRYFFNP